MNNNIFNDILLNEFTWFESIGLTTYVGKNYYRVIDFNREDIDFNFAHVINNIPLDSKITAIRVKRDYIEKCNLINLEDKQLVQTDLYCYRVIDNIKRNKTCYSEIITIDDKIILKETSNKKNTINYEIKYNDSLCGLITLIQTNNVLGIYNLEVKEGYRRKGIASSVIKHLISLENFKIIYTLTWLENESAKNCYFKSGLDSVILLDYYR